MFSCEVGDVIGEVFAPAGMESLSPAEQFRRWEPIIRLRESLQTSGPFPLLEAMAVQEKLSRFLNANRNRFNDPSPTHHE